MTEKDNKTSRRKVLSTTGAFALTGIAGVQGASGKKHDDEHPGKSGGKGKGQSADATLSGSVKLKAENGGTKQEWKETMEQRGRNPSSSLESGDSVQIAQEGEAGNLQNLTYVDHWKDTAQLSPDCKPGDDADFDIEHLCTVYKAVDSDNNIVQDSNGDYRYIVELWEQAEVTDESTWCSSAQVKELKSEIHDNQYDDITFHDRDPSTTYDVNDERLTVRQYAEVNGVAFGADQVVEYDDGTFGPDEWTPGPGGDYVVSWEGEDRTVVDMIAFVDIGSESQIDFDDWTPMTWDYYTRVGY
ncbi:hypothetical protein [Natrinema amylolyticum]|uniref:hypothetical protein n=1 Tax=Natrinema amylolyticum TaxID=2878679 RepID=UPI001CFADAAE|nr:hypothetical protein [Natrinema amylolyticum]